MATTTLQKGGGGGRKGAKFSKVFEGFCLRLLVDFLFPSFSRPNYTEIRARRQRKLRNNLIKKFVIFTCRYFKLS